MEHELLAEGRLAFHPDLKHRLPYHAQREAAKPYIRAFEQGRLPHFLRHFEQLLAKNGEYFAGDAFSYVDLQVFVIMRACEHQFPVAFKTVRIVRLKAFLQRIAQRPRIEAYLKSDRCKPFAGDSLM